MAYSTIDIGPGAANYDSSAVQGSTYIDKANPANAAGVLTSVELFFVAGGQGVKVGTFSGSGTSYDDRDYESIGSVSVGSKQTITGLNIDVSSGDFLGTYFYGNNSALEANTSGGTGVYYASGDKFGSGSATYSSFSLKIAIYATGVTIPDAPTSVSASDSTYTDKVVITWTAGTGETGGHRVYRDGVDVSGVVAHGTATYDDTTATAGTTYTYTVKAINDAGLSDASTADNGTRASSGTTSFIQQIMRHHFIPPFIGGILWLVSFHLKRIQPSLCILRFIKATGRSLPIPAR